MNSRAVFGLGIALCLAISGGTYFGARAILEEIRAGNEAREARLAALEAQLETLEHHDRLLRIQLRDLAERPEIATAGSAEDAGAEDPHPWRTQRGAPGAVVSGRTELSAEEQAYLEQYPPSANSIVVRGPEGKLGFLKISSKNDGIRDFARLDEENMGLIEELSTAILDLDRARQDAMVDLAARDRGASFPTMQEAFEHGRAHGSYYVLPLEEGFRVFAAREVEEDFRVASVSSLVDRIKEDFGDFTSYVINWVDPVIE